MQRFSDWKNDPWRNVDASCLPAMKSWPGSKFVIGKIEIEAGCFR